MNRAMSNPNQGFPVKRVPATPANAPVNMIPSTPIFKMPDRSEMISPKDTNKSGVASDKPVFKRLVNKSISLKSFKS